MLVSRSYRVKNCPRAPGAFEPWIELWQLTHARAIKRVFTLAFGLPTGLPAHAVEVSPGWHVKPPAAP
jgi:hypothetical protein